MIPDEDWVNSEIYRVKLFAVHIQQGTLVSEIVVTYYTTNRPFCSRYRAASTG